MHTRIHHLPGQPLQTPRLDRKQLLARTVMVQTTPTHLTEVAVFLRVAEGQARPDRDVFLGGGREVEGGENGGEAVGGGCLLSEKSDG